MVLTSWMVILPSPLRSIFAVVAALRIIEVFQVAVNAALFDALGKRRDEFVASRSRMITLAGINYLDFALSFSLIYSADLGRLHGADSYILTAYASFMTQLAVGYSDVYPTGWLRIVSVIQALVSLAFVLLVLGRFIASLPRMQSVFD